MNVEKKKILFPERFYKVMFPPGYQKHEIVNYTEIIHKEVDLKLQKDFIIVADW